MPRRKVDKPTHIYWLIDIRPEIIAAGWGNGQPFYCGKTVKSPDRRLSEHKSQALQRPNRAVSRRVTECKGHIIVRVMEIVSPENDWRDREKHWIAMIRCAFPAVNVSDGGEGVPGNIHTPETRAKQSQAAANRTPEHRYKLGCSMRGKTHSEAVKHRLREANAARNFSPEQKAEISRKISAALTGKKRTLVQREQMSLQRRGRKPSPETREKLCEVRRRRGPPTEAERQKISATLKGHIVSTETREKLRLAHTGRVVSSETREKLRKANTGKTLSAEHRAKISAAHLVNAETKRQSKKAQNSD